MAQGMLYGVGLGPGDPRHMTLRAADVLRHADKIFTVASPNSSFSVSGAAVEALGGVHGELCQLTFSMSRNDTERQEAVERNARLIAEALASGLHCAFATIGDAMTYSTFGYVLEVLRRMLPGLEVEIVPGVNSFSALAAASGRVLVEDGQMLRVIPAFRSENAKTLSFEPGSTTILLKTYRSRQALVERLRHEPDIDIVYGERLGLNGAFVCDDLEALEARPETYLSLMMVKKR